MAGGDLLSGLRVLELAGDVAGPYSGRLLADLGADVVKLEFGSGDIARRRPPFPATGSRTPDSGLFAYLNAGKRIVRSERELADDPDRLAELVPDCDLLVEDLPPGRLAELGFGIDRLRELRPSLVVVSVTPFGQDGPRSTWLGDDFGAFHASGWAHSFPSHVVPRLDLPPLDAPSHAGGFLVGEVAATAAMSALLKVRYGGAGAHIDVSMQEALAANNQSRFNVAAMDAGATASAASTREVSPTPGSAVVSLLPCSDGWVSLSAREDHQWARWMALLGGPPWADDPRLADRPGREQAWEWLYPLIAEHTTRMRRHDLATRAQEAGIPCLPLGQAADLLDSPQLRDRDFFREVTVGGAGSVRVPGRPYHVVDGPEPADPPGGRDADPHKPLAGVRVVDLSWVLSGPICTKYLAALGAEVIKIETRTRGDLSSRTAAWEAINLGKRSFTVDLKTEDGRQLVRDLVARSDVVVENFSTGVMERLGLGYDALTAVNPGIVVASSSSFGRTGPDRSLVAYGTLIQCLTGWAEQASHPGEVPASAGGVWADPLLGVLEALVVQAALWRRARTGVGGYLDLSLAEVTLASMPEPVLTWQLEGRSLAPQGNRDRLHAPQGCYPAAGDDSWIAVSVHGDSEWRALCARIGRDDLRADPALADANGRRAQADRIDAAIAEWTARFEAGDAAKLLQDAGVAACPTLRADELLTDPHLRERGFLGQVPALSGELGATPGLPWLTDGVRVHPPGSAPVLGEANNYVLGELLGRSGQEREELVTRGIVN